MNRPVRTGVPPRVTSVTSTTPRAVVTSSRRPFFVATMSNVWTPCPGVDHDLDPIASHARTIPQPPMRTIARREVRAMRRWNGWGDERPSRRGFAEAAARLLETRSVAARDAAAGRDARRRRRAVPPSRLADDPRLSRSTRRIASDTPAARACPTGSRSAAAGSTPSRMPSRDPTTATRSGRSSALAAGPARRHPVRRRDERRRRRHRATGRRPAGRSPSTWQGSAASATSTSGAASRRSAPGRSGPGSRRRSRRTADPRPRPAVVGALDGRRLGRGARSAGPAVARLRPDRGAVRGRPLEAPGRDARRCRRTRRRPPAPTSASSSSARRAGSGS